MLNVAFHRLVIILTLSVIRQSVLIQSVMAPKLSRNYL